MKEGVDRILNGSVFGGERRDIKWFIGYIDPPPLQILQNGGRAKIGLGGILLAFSLQN